MKKPMTRLDLFCGGGGASTGGDMAFEEAGVAFRGFAVDHWHVSVATYNANHPHMKALCMGVEAFRARSFFPDGKIDYVWASPTCTFYSRARGGLPTNDQERAQPFLVTQLCADNFVRHLTVENVPEILNWGPVGINGKPIESKKGELFKQWVETIRKCNYNVEWRIVNCADYGDATTRQRFFLKAVRKGCGKIRWPEPTHAKHPGTTLFNMRLKPWRGAIEFLDLSDPGRSIFARNIPLADNTLRRVWVGMAKFNGIFLMDMLGSGGGDLCRVHDILSPIPAQHASGNRTAVVRPFIVRFNRNGDAESIEEPLSTVTAGGQHHALCTPFIVRANRGCYAESVNAPLSSQQAHTVHHALCQPMILDHFRNGTAHGADEPLGTQTTHDRYSLLTPLILGQQSGAAARPGGEPCPTISTGGAIRVVLPVVMDKAVGLPRLPDGRYLDIRMRMLKPSELAAAHSFPPDYVFKGTRTEQIRQIGNSVPVRTAAAMHRADLECA